MNDVPLRRRSKLVILLRTPIVFWAALKIGKGHIPLWTRAKIAFCLCLGMTLIDLFPGITYRGVKP